MEPALPRPVKILGLVSLFTDASSDMIYPLLPAFLTATVGAGPAFLGLVEGIAQAVAALLKIASGSLSDRLSRRKPLVVAGYGLSSAVRPLVALATAPVHVLLVRVLDRAGKGVREGPRDALLAALAPEAHRGRAYGFHRALDHAGAVLGPLLATGALLALGDLRLVFALAAVPAVLAMVVLIWGVREGPGVPPASLGSPPGSPHGRDRSFRLYLAVLAVFALGNSADAFLLLRAQEAGVALALIPLLWAFHHVVKAGFSTPGGVLADRVGRRKAILSGWAVYALAYTGFAVASSASAVWALFGLYGLFPALTEGPERALVADLASSSERGRAFGFYHAITGGMALPASLLTGVLWQRLGSATALTVGAALAGLAALGLWMLVREDPRPARVWNDP